MAKKQSFSDKLQKQAAAARMCPKCKTEKKSVVYFGEKYAASGHWSPRRTVVQVCNCNKKEIYG